MPFILIKIATIIDRESGTSVRKELDEYPVVLNKEKKKINIESNISYKSINILDEFLEQQLKVTKQFDNGEIGYWVQRVFEYIKGTGEFEQVKNMLDKKEEWSEREEGIHYNMYKPEYQIIVEWDDELPSSLEFYSYAMENTSTRYGKVIIKYKETNLFSTFVISLDSGRYIVTQPDWGFLHFDRYKRDLHSFKYYIENSIEFRLYKFMYNQYNEEQYYANERFLEIIIIFKSEFEKEDFIDYVQNNRELFWNKIEKMKGEFDYIEADNKLVHDKITMQLKMGVALNEMLMEFREKYG